MNKRKEDRQRQEQPNQNQRQRQGQPNQNQRQGQPENMEFGEEFNFDQKREQPNGIENKERRNNRK
ncbi:hypothetical protein CSV79_04180 [Sporosarcina sp. P13]|uniref:hypothetical protein n=1 Tax=Sporosarcina sp. P13 TaxID=2048263 RepID=UPI000C16C536|nr:hypothetical protein [Sporosarcina sp. P13]PIC64827.1 hypothetical protein CSV79_04180 [Sporosarcina sp. P13]